MNRADRVTRAADIGEEALWQKVAQAFPEVKTGDTDPLSAHTLSTTIRAAVSRWVADNAGVPYLLFRNDTGDDVLCSCGNTVMDEGFQPVTISRTNGRATVTECDPTPEDWPVSLMQCGRCGAVYHEPISTGRWGESMRGEYV